MPTNKRPTRQCCPKTHVSKLCRVPTHRKLARNYTILNTAVHRQPKQMQPLRIETTTNAAPFDSQHRAFSVESTQSVANRVRPTTDVIKTLKSTLNLSNPSIIQCSEFIYVTQKNRISRGKLPQNEGVEKCASKIANRQLTRPSPSARKFNQNTTHNSNRDDPNDLLDERQTVLCVT